MTQESEKPTQPPLWRRLVARLSAFAEAMEMSETEFQARRLSALERRLAGNQAPEQREPVSRSQ